MPPRPWLAPSLAEIDELARIAYGAIPHELRRFAEDVVIRVIEFPDRETESEMGLESPFDILGLYRGVPFGERGVSHTPQDVDMILLYRRPLLDYWCETGEDLSHIVRHVLIHEIGHHFGFSDEAMERIEREAEPG
jgi:predicted Zn-dependent protease with MMP-like domain